MKRILFIIFILAISVPSFATAVITGSVQNVKSRFVYLVYMGSDEAAAPNYYGEKRLCQEIQNNHFSFVIGTSPDYSTFILEFEEDRQSIRLLVKDNDSIHVSMDLDQIANTFEATGQGASMTNFSFAADLLMPKDIPEITPEDIIPFWKKQQEWQLRLIEDFRTGELKSISGLTNEKILAIKRLVSISSLSVRDYKLLESRSNYLMVSAIRRTPYAYLMEHIDDYLDLLAPLNFSSDYIENDFVTTNLVSDRIWLTGVKKAMARGITDRKGKHEYLNDHFVEIMQEFLKGDILQKTICDAIYTRMLNDDNEAYEQIYLKNKELITNPVYRKKIEEYHINYMNALTNPKYNLDAPQKELNDSAAFALLKSFHGKKIYLTVWDVDSNTSFNLTPLWYLSKMDLLQKKYGDDVVFLNVCVGKLQQKQQWASLIVNTHWTGNHYFYVEPEQSEFKKEFDYTQGLYSCGGEIYYIIDENGQLLRKNRYKMITLLGD